VLVKQMTKKASQKPKPTVSVVGAGRLGQALAIALGSSGYPVVALVARRRQKAEKAVALLHKTLNQTKPPPLALAANELAELPTADLILIATPDDLIAETAQRLSALLRTQQRATVLHTSGALSSSALAPLAEKGFQTGSIHPLVSISEPLSGATALHGAFFCLEGSRKAKLLAEAIVRNLGGSSFAIKPENKALYHAAAVMAAPHVTALVDLAIETLAACGLSKSKAQQVLVPLLVSTVNNLKTSNPRQALTGTFARGDVATVRRHLQVLSRPEFTEALEIYKLLGLHSVRLAEKNGLDSELLRQIRKLLDREKRGRGERGKE
jgi:predicted short-subunit dehydrogenase-like oxidoreductase (DUF2520 family)